MRPEFGLAARTCLKSTFRRRREDEKGRLLRFRANKPLTAPGLAAPASAARAAKIRRLGRFHTCQKDVDQSAAQADVTCPSASLCRFDQPALIPPASAARAAAKRRLDRYSSCQRDVDQSAAQADVACPSASLSILHRSTGVTYSHCIHKLRLQHKLTRI